MDWQKLIESALVLVIGFLLKWFFGLIGFAIDDALFNTLVGAIVAWLMAQFTLNTGAAAVRAVRAARF